MAVNLKRSGSTVIESLRSSRRALDEGERLRHRSLEEATQRVRKLVEGDDWKFGPASLLATFSHHAIARTRDGSLVRVEWNYDANADSYALGAAKAFESQTPVADIGAELFETARAAATKILDNDLGGVGEMIASMSEALNTEGDLQRRITTEMAVRSVRRDAWWHGVVNTALEAPVAPPAPRTEGSDLIVNSVKDLVAALREAARDAAQALRRLDETGPDAGLITLAQDIAHDITNANTALMNADTANETELVGVYENVHSVAGHLLSGALFLKQLAQTTTS